MARHKFPETHGLWSKYKAEYRCWQDMIQRCHNHASQSFQGYGGRGIFVCDRWRESFENFLSDMGARPHGHSLDRINNDGPYSIENCRWASAKTQNRNRRVCIYLEHNGKRQTAIEWAEELGIDARTIRARYAKGLSPDQVLSKAKFLQHRARPNNKSGLLGVSKYREKWKASINVGGVMRYLGLFETPEDANAAYLRERAALKEKNA